MDFCTIIGQKCPYNLFESQLSLIPPENNSSLSRSLKKKLYDCVRVGTTADDLVRVGTIDNDGVRWKFFEIRRR